MSGPGDRRVPASAAQLAAEQGDALPTAESVPPEAFALCASIRRLVEATVLTDVAADELARVTAEVDALTDALAAHQRDHLHLVRHPDGRIESLRQAGSGALNPQAPPVEWVHRPTEPPLGSTPTPVEVTARCRFTAAHGGSPQRVYGGIVALVLDEVTGVAIRVAGASGLTVALDVSLHGAVPIGVPVDITARYTGGEGRKSYASGELSLDGDVLARATVVYVTPRT